MDDFERIFEAYGADYQVTLGRFMGNRKMYMKFLGMLFQDENLSKLGDALEQGDMTSAFEAAHTLKGVTGNMGLTPLYDAVCTIVEPLRTGRTGRTTQRCMRMSAGSLSGLKSFGRIWLR